MKAGRLSPRALLSRLSGDTGLRVELSACSDERLVEWLRNGEERAFEVLFQRYRDRIYQFVCWQGVPGRDAAEDLTQEIFFQMLRGLDGFRGRSSFRTWLYALARNCCRYRSRSRRSERRWRGGGDEEEAVTRAADPAAGAEERLQRREAARGVRLAVRSLSPEHRTVLLLRDWEELSYQEMAEILEIPLGTVRSRLFHARAALARRLRGEDQPEEGRR